MIHTEKRTAFRNILSNCRAAAAIEFALVLPLYLLLLMGILEYALVVYASATLEGALVVAARAGKTGYVATGQTQIQYIDGIVQNRISGLLNPSNMRISSYAYDNFGAVAAPAFPNCGPSPLSACAQNAGASGQVVLYTVTYPWHVTTPLLQPFLGKAGTLTLSASALVKNEPYSVTAR